LTLRFVHHRIEAAPRRWQAVAERLSRQDGTVYGVWRSQIGRPRDELQALTIWRQPMTVVAAETALLGDRADIVAASSEALTPTLRPSDAAPPTRQGNYAFRWFATPSVHWREFLELCAAAWPAFESAYDSQVIGLWQASGERTGPAADGATGAGRQGVRSLLLTRRPNLAMWERSKLPQGPAEAAMRAQLSRRYDLCDWTVVSTATLLTATDHQDTARWT
jgi:hypothetical protein